MYAVTVLITLHPGYRAEFLPLIRANATASLAHETECHRFDVCTDSTSDDEVFLYELYTDRAGFDAHRATPHYAIFDTQSAKMIADKAVRTFDGVQL